MMAMEVSERERFDMFVESARAFCSWIEGLPELPSDGLWDLDEALALELLVCRLAGLAPRATPARR